MKERRCAFCQGNFEPEPQAVRVIEGVRRVTQKSCERAACRQTRKTETERRWQISRPDWAEKHRERQRSWCARNPGYWRTWRRKNAAYRRRERQRQRRRRKERVAKINGIRTDPVGEVRRIRKMGRKGVAKINGIALRLDEALNFLEDKERVAKTNGLASGTGAG